MHEEFLVIGTGMILSSIIILILGLKKSTRHIWFWFGFPFFHGTEEILEYFIANNPRLPFFIERTELLLGILASVCLFIAVVELNGQIPTSGSVLAGGVMAALLGTMALSFPEIVIDAIEKDPLFQIGFISTTPFQFVTNFLIPILAGIVLFVTQIRLKSLQGKRNIQISRSEMTVFFSLESSLLLFSLFEGLTSENSIFLLMQTFVTILFVIIPLVVIFLSKPGLQRFLVIDATNGFLIYGYHFTTRDVISSETNNDEHDDALLVSAFLAALSGFSGDYLQSGTTLKLESNQTHFYISRVNDTIFTLQTLLVTESVEKAFNYVVTELGKLEQEKDRKKTVDFSTTGITDQKTVELFTNVIIENFKGLY